MLPKRVSRLPTDSNATCWECSYPLKGLLVTGKCPECGCAVRYSLARARLAKTGSSTKATNVLVGVNVAYWFLSFANIIWAVEDSPFRLIRNSWWIVFCLVIPITSTIVVLLMRASGIRFKWGSILSFVLSAIGIALMNLWVHLSAYAAF